MCALVSDFDIRGFNCHYSRIRNPFGIVKDQNEGKKGRGKRNKKTARDSVLSASKSHTYDVNSIY